MVKLDMELIFLTDIERYHRPLGLEHPVEEHEHPSNWMKKHLPNLGKRIPANTCDKNPNLQCFF